jgi:hypothetical protein
MSKLQSVNVPKVDSLMVSISLPNRIALEGTITGPDPTKQLGGIFKSIHEAALADGLSDVLLDITALKFVNSSAIRLFLDWASWVKSVPVGGYELQILTTKRFTWQKTSFGAIASLTRGAVRIRTVD